MHRFLILLFLFCASYRRCRCHRGLDVGHDLPLALAIELADLDLELVLAFESARNPDIFSFSFSYCFEFVFGFCFCFGLPRFLIADAMRRNMGSGRAWESLDAVILLPSQRFLLAPVLVPVLVF